MKAVVREYRMQAHRQGRTGIQACHWQGRAVSYRIAQAQLVSEPPEVLLTPRLGQLGPFEYYRAAMAIAEGREAVIQMLPAIHGALAG
jgi:hypothetical protein